MSANRRRRALAAVTCRATAGAAAVVVSASPVIATVARAGSRVTSLTVSSCATLRLSRTKPAQFMRE